MPTLKNPPIKARNYQHNVNAEHLTTISLVVFSSMATPEFFPYPYDTPLLHRNLCVIQK